MRLKLGISTLLLALLVSSSHAECSKSEVMKLIDKGFSKTEINSICDIQAKSSKKPKPKRKWITPSNSTCRDKGAHLYKGICEANWQQAKNICRVSGGRLPSKSELIAVILECGGSTANNDSVYKENREDPNYQHCVKKKGFAADNTIEYWTSSMSDDKKTWVMDFETGHMYKAWINQFDYFVRCVSVEQ